MSLKELYPNAFNFFAGYFHEDVSSEFEQPEDAVRQFIVDTDPQMRVQVRDEIAAMRRDLPREQLPQAVFELGCYYDPPKHRSISVEEWLDGVQQQLNASVKE